MIMKVKYLHYDNTDGSVTGYTIDSALPPTGYYLKDQTLDSDFDDECYEVVDVGGVMTLQEKTQTEQDAVLAARTAANNLQERKKEVAALSYTFYKALKDNWATLPSTLTAALTDWKTSMDTIWTDHPE